MSLKAAREDVDVGVCVGAVMVCLLSNGWCCTTQRAVNANGCLLVADSGGAFKVFVVTQLIQR